MRTTPTIQDILLKIVISLAISIPFILLPAFSFANPTHHIKGISINIDGNPITFEYSPYIDNRHTIVPIREMAQYLGAEVEWDPGKKTITLKKEQQSILLKIDSNQALLNEQTVTLAQPVQLAQDKAFAPLRFMAEGLNTEVVWNPSNRSVDIQLTKELSIKQAEDAVRNKLNIPLDSDIIVEFDFELEEGVYAIHVYKIVDDHTATLSWYVVDAVSGSVESMF